MLDYVIYGKIIIDNICLPDGQVIEDLLGGGGPQAVFGACLWSDSVGFLSRSGTDIGPHHVAEIQSLGCDVSGWVKYPDLPTTVVHMTYDEAGNRVKAPIDTDKSVGSENWRRLLERELSLPNSYRSPKVIHLISERPEEPMIETALELRQRGTLFSLEPLIDWQTWRNRDGFLSLMKNVDLVTPDWPSASGIAGSAAPQEVLRYWSRLGPKMVAIRHGQQGSYVWDSNHDRSWHLPPLPVKVVDPTGAGNSYGGGLCVVWHQTADAKLAGSAATVSASYMVQQYGMPRWSVELKHQARALLAQVEQAARPM